MEGTTFSFVKDQLLIVFRNVSGEIRLEFDEEVTKSLFDFMTYHYNNLEVNNDGE